MKQIDWRVLAICFLTIPILVPFTLIFPTLLVLSIPFLIVLSLPIALQALFLYTLWNASKEFGILTSSRGRSKINYVQTLSQAMEDYMVGYPATSTAVVSFKRNSSHKTKMVMSFSTPTQAWSFVSKGLDLEDASIRMKARLSRRPKTCFLKDMYLADKSLFRPQKNDESFRQMIKVTSA
jgi:hypothetical protein